MKLAPGVRRLALAVRSLPVRLLHPVRRRATVGRLTGQRPPGSVLFICHGNICRSPDAATVFSRHLPLPFRDAVRADSVGFIGPGRPAPPNALQVTARRGIDLAGHRSRVVTPNQWAEAQLVVAMELGQRPALQTLFGRDGRKWWTKKCGMRNAECGGAMRVPSASG